MAMELPISCQKKVFLLTGHPLSRISLPLFLPTSYHIRTNVHLLLIARKSWWWSLEWWLLLSFNVCAWMLCTQFMQKTKQFGRSKEVQLKCNAHWQCQLSAIFWWLWWFEYRSYLRSLTQTLYFSSPSPFCPFVAGGCQRRFACLPLQKRENEWP